MSTPNTGTKKKFAPSITTFFASKSQPGNFVSVALNEVYKDNPSGFETLMKTLTPNHKFYLAKGGVDKNGNDWYRLNLLDPADLDQNQGRSAGTKRTAKKEESEI